MSSHHVIGSNVQTYQIPFSTQPPTCIASSISATGPPAGEVPQTRAPNSDLLSQAYQGGRRGSLGNGGGQAGAAAAAGPRAEEDGREAGVPKRQLAVGELPQYVQVGDAAAERYGVTAGERRSSAEGA